MKLTSLFSLNTKINTAFHYLNTNTQNTQEAPPSTTTDNYVGFISAEHLFKNLTLKLNFAAGNINKNRLYQYGFNAVYAPFYNASLLVACDLQLQNTNGSQTLFIKPEITFRALKNMWLGFQYFRVNGFNMIESDAFLVNNSGDKTIDRSQLFVNYRINDHFSLYFVSDIFLCTT